MELRSRSRSKTPFQLESFIGSSSESTTNYESNVVVTRSSRKSTTSSSSKTIKPTRRSSKLFKTVITSDYSSEDDGTTTNSSSHISENEKNQIIQDARAAANGTSEISALNLYRKAGRYWDKYPKTDWTYSPHSRDRIEIAPGVVQMPNMSRPSIHCGTNTDTSYFEKYKQNVKQKLFTSTINNNKSEEEETKFKINYRRTTIFTRIYTVILWWLFTVYQVVNSSTLYLMKKVHRFVSRVMLLDTWILRKNSTKKRTRALVILCLLPLLLFTVWWLLGALNSAIFSSYSNPSTNPQQQQQQILPNKNLNIIESTTPTKEIDIDSIVEQILKSNKINKIISNDQNTQEQVELLKNTIAELKDEANRVKAEIHKLEQTKSIEYNRLISQYHTESQRNIAFLTQKINKCCNQKPIIPESLIANILSGLLNDPEFLSQQHGLNNWLQTIFLTKSVLEQHLSNLTLNLSEKFQQPIESTAEHVFEKVINKLKQEQQQQQIRKTTITNNYDLDEDRIREIVAKSLKIYDADKTGLVDYAMEPLGGQIITTRCTETYSTGGVISVLGLPLWNIVATPRVAITPGIVPGECWAFQNFPGFLVIKLAYTVRIDAFSMEHVSPLLIPDGKRDSAPKDFQVFGIQGEDDKNPILIGEYQYDINGETIQYFEAQSIGLVFNFVELRINSNHGNPLYSCLYRFRVHGKIQNDGERRVT